MNILLREAQILCPHSPHHGQVAHVHIQDGLIRSIDHTEPDADTVVEAKDMRLSLGWMDLRAHFHDPGLEQHEDLHSGCQVAASGGFTGVALLPNLQPITQTKSHVAYLKTQSAPHLTEVHPMAAVSPDTKGEGLTDLLDLHQAGAVAFTDGDVPIWHTDTMRKALMYLQKIDGLLINLPQDPLLTRFGVMNEGISSTRMGLQGIPKLAEHLMIKRDVELLKYTGGKVHFANISSEESVRIIQEAKKQGLRISCDVSIHHLIHTDGAFADYDTRYKINPPLSTEKDRQALIQGVKAGVIDAITSSHTPKEEEAKKLAFDRAAFGISGLQTLLPMLLTLSEALPPEVWIETLTTQPRALLKLSQPRLEVNQPANLTLFNPQVSWRYDDQSNRSKAKNSPFFDQTLTGKVKAIIHGLKYEIFE